MIRILEANESHAEILVGMINRAFDIEKFFIDGDRTDLAEVLEKLAQGTFLLASVDNAIAGCVYLELRERSCYLGLLAVDPAMHGLGLGKYLVSAAEDHALKNEKGLMKLRIASPREELPLFYQKLGYTEAAIEEWPADAPTKFPCHFIRMEKPLMKNG